LLFFVAHAFELSFLFLFSLFMNHPLFISQSQEVYPVVSWCLDLLLIFFVFLSKACSHCHLVFPALYMLSSFVSNTLCHSHPL
jgi:hypothetical protein